MNHKIFAALATGVVLSGCSGAASPVNTGTTVVTPAPTPSPTPTPSTPTPTPTPSSVAYSTFASLTGDQQYASACLGYTPRGSAGVPIPTSVASFARAGLINYTAATQTFRVFAPNNVQQTFTAADRVAGTPSGTESYAKPSTTAGATERFSIIQPTPSGVGLDYARVSISDFEGSATSGTRARTTSYCVLGVPTLVTDIPAAVSVTFTRFAVTGEAQDIRSGTQITYSLANSTATMTVDLTTGNFISNLHLIGTSASGATIDLGTYAEQGSLDASSAGFFGAPPVVTFGALQPRVFGGFFGPQGREFGYVFSGSQSTTTSPVDFALIVTGAVVGSR